MNMNIDINTVAVINNLDIHRNGHVKVCVCAYIYTHTHKYIQILMFSYICKHRALS